MKRISRLLACVAGASLCFVQTAWAGADVESELAEMRELVQGLQEQVDAQDEQLSHQGEMLEDAQEAVRDSGESESLSGLAAFIDSLEVDGLVAGSYFFNWNQPDLTGPKPVLGAPGTVLLSGFGGAGGNTGTSGAFYALHPDHNSFSVDQVWFGLGKPATNESRAGFRFDLMFGQTASIVGTGIARAGLDGVSDIYVHQAYVEYLAPVLEDGVRVRAGKFAKNGLYGTEYVPTSLNFNVTRGNLFHLFQPIDHVGLIVDTKVSGVLMAAGIVNSSNLTGPIPPINVGNQPDNNKLKSFIGQLGYEMDMAKVTGTVIYGGDIPGNNASKEGLLDVAAFIDPMENLALTANFNYAWNEGVRVNTLPFGQAINTAPSRAYGFGLAGRYAVTEDVGLSLRGEYAKDRGNHFLILGAANSEIMGLTFTTDYQLVEHLMVRAEARWDRVNERTGTAVATGPIPREFLEKNTNFKRDQFTTGVEVVYTF